MDSVHTCRPPHSPVAATQYTPVGPLIVAEEETDDSDDYGTADDLQQPKNTCTLTSIRKQQYIPVRMKLNNRNF